MAEDLETRIRQRAYEIWEREGRPEGRRQDHWELAREEIAIEDNYRGTLKPNPSHGPDDTAEHTEPVEPVLSMASQGEMPGIADQGEEFQIPGTGDREAWPSPDQAGQEAAAPRSTGRARRSRKAG
ncbi:DUF2934 domain-containing protein [Azospirillum thermophilum]|uniref:DUF2934 domain-containing protein n=1 Tax=Azospirillum thermophilum TaxID=2202148 RepID=A0A2S2CQE5_9PROT|nr:DUF2934 domain-containing protein [Azospirillum thermophilum]AWK86711.1 DUF2934 domain-containing protein [Azospirillum thermophilum]